MFSSQFQAHHIQEKRRNRLSCLLQGAQTGGTIYHMTSLAFLIDVDNTLLANDGIKSDLDAHIRVEMGPAL